MQTAQRRQRGRPRSGEEEKQVWVDHVRKLVSFHEIPEAAHVKSLEGAFWLSVLQLLSLGYRVQ